MSEQYIDPNSGAAAQPGGASIEAPAPIEAVVNKDGAVEGIDAQKLEQNQLEQADKKAELDQTGVQTYVESGDLVVGEDGTDQVVTKTVKGAGAVDETKESEDSDGSDGDDSADASSDTPVGSTESSDGSESTETVTDSTETVKTTEVEAFDPSAHTGDQVLEYILENPEQQEAILAAERAGKNRKTVVNAF